MVAQQSGIAQQQPAPVGRLSAHAMPGDRLESFHPYRFDRAAARRRHDRLGQGVFRPRLDSGGKTEQS